MARFLGFLAAAGVSLLCACSSNESGTSSGSGTGSGSGSSSSTAGSGGGSSSSMSGSGGESTTSSGNGGAGGSSSGSGGAGGGMAGPPTAADLLALLSACNEVSAGKYKTDDEAQLPSNIPICGLKGAVYWQADMDVDCDGKMTQQCNLNTDPAYQNQTSATDSNGDPLDAAALPFVVIPLPSFRFDYNAADLSLGSVVAVIYKGQVEYGIFGDEGPNNIIGEASYAMAKSLGIDPDPSTGGTDSGVTYIAFTGSSGVVKTLEDHGEAVTVGQTRATQLINEN